MSLLVGLGSGDPAEVPHVWPELLSDNPVSTLSPASTSRGCHREASQAPHRRPGHPWTDVTGSGPCPHLTDAAQAQRAEGFPGRPSTSPLLLLQDRAQQLALGWARVSTPAFHSAPCLLAE